MKLLEIVNPSDPYTISGDDEPAAAFAVLLLGRGAYGLVDEDGKTILPVILFGGSDQWVKEAYGCSLEEWAKSFTETRMAIAFESVRIGSIAANRELDDLLSCITEPAKREEFMAKRHDKQRSSMNDIGARAAGYARAFRARASAKGAVA